MPVKSVAKLGNHSNQASNDTPPELARLKSMPVWRMAFWAVSPSIPTQALAANEEPETPAGLLGVGTVKRPVTEVKVEPAGGAWMMLEFPFIGEVHLDWEVVEWSLWS